MATSISDDLGNLKHQYFTCSENQLSYKFDLLMNILLLKTFGSFIYIYELYGVNQSPVIL